MSIFYGAFMKGKDLLCARDGCRVRGRRIFGDEGKQKTFGKAAQGNYRKVYGAEKGGEVQTDYAAEPGSASDRDCKQQIFVGRIQ